MAFLARVGTEFYPSGAQGQGSGAPAQFLEYTLSALRANMKRGDVLCVMNNRGLQDYDWLESKVLADIIEPAGATLLLLGDNPHLNNAPVICHTNRNRCSGVWHLSTPGDAQLQSFAGQHRNVSVFLQTPLWLAEPGTGHFWGNVPGTNTNAYEDVHHLLSVGAHYLSPHLCSFFVQEGLFG